MPKLCLAQIGGDDLQDPDFRGDACSEVTWYNAVFSVKDAADEESSRIKERGSKREIHRRGQRRDGCSKLDASLSQALKTTKQCSGKKDKMASVCLPSYKDEALEKETTRRKGRSPVARFTRSNKALGIP